MEILCVYLEDSASDFELWSQTLQQAIPQLSIEPAKTHSEAIALIEKLKPKLFVADLLIKENGEDRKRGLLAVEHAAKNYPNLAIVGLSQGEGSHPGIRQEFEQLAPNGKYIDKRMEPPKYSLETLRKDITKLLEAHGHAVGPKPTLVRPLLAPGKKLELDAEIDAIGEPKLLSLLDQLCPEMGKFEVHYVAPGFSGAALFRVVAYDRSDRERQTLLVKISNELGKLQTELARSPKPADPDASIYVPLIQGLVARTESLTAIAGQFADDAVTLREWLTSSPSETQVVQVLTELFQRLGKVYHLGEVQRTTSLLSSLLPNIQSMARMRRAIKNAEPILKRAGNSIDENLLLEFLVDRGRIKGHSEAQIPIGTTICMCHGDLHTRNILIAIPGGGTPPRPILVDPARRLHRHWASDIARLAADLWVSCVDPATDAFWESLPVWNASFREWHAGGNANLKMISENKATWTALIWIRDKSFEISQFPSEFRSNWQFDVALAVELLHLSVFDNVPMPKRAFAILAGEDLLRSLGTAIPWQSN